MARRSDPASAPRTFIVDGHGKGSGTPKIELGKIEDGPVGIPAPVPEEGGPIERHADGRFASGDAAREAARRGGLAKAANNVHRWARSLGMGRLLQGLEAEDRLVPFTKDADAWYRAQVQHVASVVGGGVCSPGVCSIIRTSAWERCFSAFLFEAGAMRAFAWDRDDRRTNQKVLPRTDLLLVASRLGDSSRQNLLAAHSLAALEARSRADAAPAGDAAAAMRARLLGGDS